MSDVIFFNRQLTADEVPEAMALSAGSPIPEPSTLVLAAIGLLSLGLSTRRRRLRPRLLAKSYVVWKDRELTLG